MELAEIEVKGATFGYSDEKVFENINLNLYCGQVLILIGSNGCGKTSLLKCMIGLQKLNSGEILLGGSDIENLESWEIARRVSYIPQIHSKTFPYTVQEIVLMGRASYTGRMSSPGRRDCEIAMEAIERVGVEGLANKPYTQLSGGQEQMVMIARALAQQSKVIIMDEPTSHLDYKNELLILRTILKLSKGKNNAIIMATHSPNHAFYFEQSKIPVVVALMYKKGILALGRPSDVLTENNLKVLYDTDLKVIDYAVNANKLLKFIVPADY